MIGKNEYWKLIFMANLDFIADQEFFFEKSINFLTSRQFNFIKVRLNLVKKVFDCAIVQNE